MPDRRTAIAIGIALVSAASFVMRCALAGAALKDYAVVLLPAIPLALVLFPEFLGETSGYVRGGTFSDRKAHPRIVAGFGWVLLCVVFLMSVVGLYRAL